MKWPSFSYRPSRPTHKELTGKLRKAIELVEAKALGIIKEDALIDDAQELGYLVEGDLFDILLDLLGSLDPNDYIGNRPPNKSYEPKIEGAEYLEFKKFSTQFNCLIYFKFTIVKDVFWLMSLHKDRS